VVSFFLFLLFMNLKDDSDTDSYRDSDSETGEVHIVVLN